MTVRVMVADDDDLMRRLLRLTLDRCDGIAVAGEAPDGCAAVALARALAPDVVVLDLAMPGLDGLAAAAAVRAELPGCGIVICSGTEAAAVAPRAAAAGVDRYVEKADGMDALAAAVLDLARGRRAQR